MRRVICVACICVTFAMVMDQVYVRICYYRFDHVPGKTIDSRLIYRLVPFLIITALADLVLRVSKKIQHRHFIEKLVDMGFCSVKCVLLLWVFVYWCNSVNTNYAEYLSGDEWVRNNMRFREDSSYYVATEYGPVIVSVYIIDLLWRFGINLKYALDANRGSPSSPKSFMRNLFFPETRMWTKGERFLRIAYAVFFVFAILWCCLQKMAAAELWKYLHISPGLVSGVSWSSESNLWIRLVDSVLFAPFNNLWLFFTLQMAKYGFVEMDK